MNIGIDIRPLFAPTRTGVGEYSYELLNSIFKIDKQNHYFLFYNSVSDKKNDFADIQWHETNIHYVATDIPSKLFNCSQKLFKYPKLEKFFPNIDYFFSPNLNFTALSLQTKFILTIHDLSFEIFPKFFSLKRRLWHKLVNPKKQCRRADIIFVPSVNTKRDIITYYG